MAKDELEEKKKKKKKDKDKRDKALKQSGQKKDKKAKKDKKKAEMTYVPGVKAAELELVVVKEPEKVVNTKSDVKKPEPKKSGLSQSLISYLTTIYDINDRGDKCTVTEVAKSLLLTKPSANRAINTLIENGYVEHEKYSEITLTVKGKKIGKAYSQKIRDVYEFLVNRLMVEEKDAMRQAKGMAAAMDDETVRKLKDI